MKNKYLSRITLYILGMLQLLIIIQSCDNDNLIDPPSSNPSIVDSIYFIWELDTMWIVPMEDMYIADTNKIFIPGSPYSVYINNGSIQHINHNDPDFGSYCINGTSSTNVYIGGISKTHGNTKLKKWNGNYVEDILMPFDTGRITRIEPITENDIWISTNNNIIYHFYNQSFTTYRLDSGLSLGTIFRDKYGNLFSQYYKFTQGNYDYLYSFKFENNSWIQVLIDSLFVGSNIYRFIGFIDNYILRSGNSGIYNFSGSKWELLINPGNNLKPYLAGGESSTNIMFQAEDRFNDYVFYFDGKTIFRMPNHIFPIIYLVNIQYKYCRYYILIENDFTGKSYFGVTKLIK